MKNETNTGIHSEEPLRLEKLTWDNYDAIVNRNVNK